MAAYLQQAGLQQQPVLLLFPIGLGFLSGYFGCLLAGAVAVPAPLPQLGRTQRLLPRILGILKDAAPALILTDRQGFPVLSALVAESPTFAAIPLRTVEELLETPASLFQPRPLAPDAVAHLQYTSGSTSEPRAVMISHHNLMACSRQIQHNKGFTADSLSVMWVPPYHDDGLVQGLLQPLYSGINCILMSPTDVMAHPGRWLKAISEHRATHSGGPNFLYEVAYHRVPETLLPELDLSSWRYAYNAAEPIRWETLRRFFERFERCGLRWSTLAPCYGLAEATLVVSATRPGDGPVQQVIDGLKLDRTGQLERVAPDHSTARTLVSSGRVVLDTEVTIVEPGGTRRLPPEQVGEILVKNDSVALGYRGQPEATAQTFGAHLDDGSGPWLRTGDLGVLSEEHLYVTGRYKDLIILRGENRYP